MKETYERARTTTNVQLTQSARILLSVKFNTKNRNNWNRYLKQISVRILLKQLDYSLSLDFYEMIVESAFGVIYYRLIEILS